MEVPYDTTVRIKGMEKKGVVCLFETWSLLDTGRTIEEWGTLRLLRNNWAYLFITFRAFSWIDQMTMFWCLFSWWISKKIFTGPCVRIIQMHPVFPEPCNLNDRGNRPEMRYSSTESWHLGVVKSILTALQHRRQGWPLHLDLLQRQCRVPIAALSVV